MSISPLYFKLCELMKDSLRYIIRVFSFSPILSFFLYAILPKLVIAMVLSKSSWDLVHLRYNFNIITSWKLSRHLLDFWHLIEFCLIIQFTSSYYIRFGNVYFNEHLLNISSNVKWLILSSIFNISLILKKWYIKLSKIFKRFK